MRRRTLVLDASILVRAVPGQQVRRLLTDHGAGTRFFAPEAAHAEAREHLPVPLGKRGVSGALALAALDALEAVVCPIEAELYRAFEAQALARIRERDPGDWPALAHALLLDCPA